MGIVELVSLVDFDGARITNYQEAMIRLRRHCLITQTLISAGARQMGIDMLQRTLRVAERFEVTDVELSCLMTLRGQIALRANQREYDRINTKLDRIMERLKLEVKADEIDERLSMPLIHAKTHLPRALDLAEKSIIEIEELRRQCDSRAITGTYFRVKAFAHLARSDYEQALAVSVETERYYQEHPEFAGRAALAQVAVNKVKCALRLRRYEEGKEYALAARAIIPEGSNNWFTSMSTHLLLALYSEDFDLALAIFRDVTTHPRFDEGVDPGRQETWKIYQGYLQYAVKCGWMSLPTDRIIGLRKQFRLSTFVNDFRTIRQDKEGENLAVLVLSALWLFETRQYEKLTTLTRSLQNYAARHLRSEGSRRGLAFMKLFLIMIESDFDANVVATKGAKYHQTLCDPDVRRSSLTEGMEVMPYDKLWAHVTAQLAERQGGREGRPEQA